MNVTLQNSALFERFGKIAYAMRHDHVSLEEGLQQILAAIISTEQGRLEQWEELKALRPPVPTTWEVDSEAERARLNWNE